MTRNLIRTILAPAVFWLATSASANAQDIFAGWAGGDCASCATSTTCCQTHHCPPALAHCQEGAPRIRVKCGCPKPICNPCNQPGWGYYETCWSPWPWPPNYNHCATLPPAATIALSGPGTQNPFYGPTPGAQPQQPAYQPNMPSTVAPSMPPVTAPPVPTTPGMPRLNPGGAGPMPPMNPNPGAGLDSLPFPRQDGLRPMPPGGAY